MSEKKKIIIFGATGNVGSYLTLYAQKFYNPDEYEIITSGKRETDFWTKRGLKYFSIDLTRKEELSQLPTENVHAVILLSAQLPAYMADYSAKEYIDSIIVGAYNVLEYCRINHVDRILYPQTIFDIGGYPTSQKIYYDTPRNFSYNGDHAMYIISKNCAVDMLEHYHQEYGIKNFVFRFPSIYSYTPNHYYYQDGEKLLRPFYKQLYRAMNGEPLELWGNPNQKRDMVHVYDLSQMLCKATIADVGGGFYNVGTGTTITLMQQCQAIIDVFSPKDHKSNIEVFPDKSSGPGLYELDITNAIQDLGYHPEYDVYRLLEDFKEEMKINRFAELRCNS